MSVIVTDAGFGPDRFTAPVGTLADLTPHSVAVELGPTDRAEVLTGHLDHLHLIRIAFPSFSDGRGFTLARDLRRMGFTGTLRASGHVLADQYAMVRRSGFDEVELTDAQAARQGAEQWQFRADWQAHDHRMRLFA